MKRKLMTATFSAVALLTTLATAQAGIDVQHLEGTRAEVRAYCLAADGVLSDRNDYSMCLSGHGATLTCYDSRQCIRTGYDLDLPTGGIPELLPIARRPEA